MKIFLLLIVSGPLLAGTITLKANLMRWPMKSVLELVTILNTPEAEFQWQHPLPSGNAMQRVAFVDSLHGYAVGTAGMILETINEGQTWQALKQPHPNTPNYTDILVLPDSSLLVTGTAPGLFHSTDGGNTWTLPHGETGITFWDLHTRPDGAISAAGDNGTVLLSLDNGLTWNDVGPGSGEIRSHLWVDDQIAFVVGRNMALKTGNGGISWQPTGATSLFGFNEVFSPVDHTIIIKGDFDTWISTDNGQNITLQLHISPRPLYPLRTLVLTEEHWLSVTFGEGTEIWQTLDGGMNWEKLYQGSLLGFTDITQAPGGRVLLCRSDGQMIYSNDLCQTFEFPQGNLNTTRRSGIIEEFVALPNGVLYAANSQGHSGDSTGWFRSDDGGTNWTIPSDWPGMAITVDCLFMDNQTGITVSGRDISYTSDGGISWQHTQLPSGTKTRQLAQAGSRCFVACNLEGQQSILYQSDDGGSSWQQNTGGISQLGEIGSLYFLDAATGFLSGRCSGDNCLYTTTDGGASWSSQVFPQLSYAFDDMLWLNAQTGIATLSRSSLAGIYRTIDGGTSWQQVNNLRTLKLYRRNNGQLAAVPVGAMDILISDDQGLSWQIWQIPYGELLHRIDGGRVVSLQPTESGWLVGGTGSTILEMIMPDSVNFSGSRISD